MYERLVGLVKTVFTKSIVRQILTFDAFQTSVAEAEAIVNSRPLTYLTDEFIIVLRPTDFISSKAILHIPAAELKDNEILPDKSWMPSTKTSEERVIQQWVASQETLR